MKKNKFLALIMLCSIFTDVPAKALEIKDSGSQKQGGMDNLAVGKAPDLESNGKTKKNKQGQKFSKKRIAKNAYFLHEFLSLMCGEPLQFYNFFGRWSLSGLLNKISRNIYLKRYNSIMWGFESGNLKVKMENITITDHESNSMIDITVSEEEPNGFCRLNEIEVKKLITPQSRASNFKLLIEEKIKLASEGKLTTEKLETLGEEKKLIKLSDDQLAKYFKDLLNDFLEDSVVFVCYEGTEKVFFGTCPKWLYDRLPTDCEKLYELSDRDPNCPCLVHVIEYISPKKKINKKFKK